MIFTSTGSADQARDAARAVVAKTPHAYGHPFVRVRPTLFATPQPDSGANAPLAALAPSTAALATITTRTGSADQGLSLPSRHCGSGTGRRSVMAEPAE